MSPVWRSVGALRRRAHAAWRARAAGYATAVLGQLGAVQCTVVLRGHFQGAFPYHSLLIVLVILAVAIGWGLGPSLLAAVAGAALSNTYLIPPYGDWFNIDDMVSAWAFGSLLTVGLAVALLEHRGARARRRAEEAVRVRDHVLTLATHDLRTPLTLAIGYAESLREEVLTERGARHAAALSEALWHINDLAQELSDVARLQIGQPLALRRERLNLVTLAAGVAAHYPQVRLRVPQEPVWVWADGARLERVLHNLLGNAVKYSPPQTPIGMEVERADGQAMARVRDQGVGIPQREVRRIGRAFYRAATAGGVEGTGLGLAGAQEVVRQHGGRLRLESRVGAGTTVTVVLPAEPRRHAAGAVHS